MLKLQKHQHLVNQVLHHYLDNKWLYKNSYKLLKLRWNLSLVHFLKMKSYNHKKLLKSKIWQWLNSLQRLSRKWSQFQVKKILLNLLYHKINQWIWLNSLQRPNLKWNQYLEVLIQYKNLSHQQLKFNNLFNLFKKRQLLHKLQSLYNNKLKVQHPTLNLLFSYRIDHQLQLNFQPRRKVRKELRGHQQLHRVVAVQLKRKFQGQSKKRLCL
jgi:hypothetical protein